MHNLKKLGFSSFYAFNLQLTFFLCAGSMSFCFFHCQNSLDDERIFRLIIGKKVAPLPVGVKVVTVRTTDEPLQWRTKHLKGGVAV